MNKQEAQNRLDYIQALLEGSARYTNVSPWSLIGAGCFGLLGSAATLVLAPTASAYGPQLGNLIILWTACFVGAVTLAVGFGVYRARRQQGPMWTRPLRRALFNASILIYLGGMLTIALTLHGLYDWIPAIWMLCYGAAAIVGGMFSLTAFRAMGVFFMACGTAALFWPELAPWLLMASFGMAHVAMGLSLARHPDASRGDPSA